MTTWGNRVYRENSSLDGSWDDSNITIHLGYTIIISRFFAQYETNNNKHVLVSSSSSIYVSRQHAVRSARSWTKHVGCLGRCADVCIYCKHQNSSSTANRCQACHPIIPLSIFVQVYEPKFVGYLVVEPLTLLPSFPQVEVQTRNCRHHLASERKSCVSFFSSLLLRRNCLLPNSQGEDPVKMVEHLQWRWLDLRSASISGLGFRRPWMCHATSQVSVLVIAVRFGRSTWIYLQYLIKLVVKQPRWKILYHQIGASSQIAIKKKRKKKQVEINKNTFLSLQISTTYTCQSNNFPCFTTKPTVTTGHWVIAFFPAFRGAGSAKPKLAAAGTADKASPRSKDCVDLWRINANITCSEFLTSKIYITVCSIVNQMDVSYIPNSKGCMIYYP